uniref:Uncharacterized protein n=1 Tax=Nelumbo nucifera TaxID=4432 RepID=A0A822ZB66_NELNU|nr:TPA_asm: hypothetical protein HUJ06_013090 [Nelumbo nucifera]
MQCLVINRFIVDFGLATVIGWWHDG